MFDDENDDVLENEEEFSDDSPGGIEDSGSGLDDDDDPRSEEGKLSWKEKRRQRGRNLVAEANREKYDAEQRALRAEQRNVELERRMNQIEGRIVGDQKKQEETDLDKQLMENYNKRVRLSREINTRGNNNEPLTDAESEQYLRETKKLDDEQYELRFKKYGAPQQQQAVQQESPQIQALKYRYGDVITNERASSWATGQIRVRLAERDVRPTQEEATQLLDEVMDSTRKRFRIGHYAKSTDASKQRFSGVGSDYSTAGGGRKSPAHNLSDTEKSMARQFYSDSDITEEEMYKKFAKEIR